VESIILADLLPGRRSWLREFIDPFLLLLAGRRYSRGTLLYNTRLLAATVMLAVRLPPAYTGPKLMELGVGSRCSEQTRLASPRLFTSRRPSVAKKRTAPLATAHLLAKPMDRGLSSERKTQA